MNNKRALILLAAAIVVSIAILVIENPDRSRIDDVSDNYFLKNFESSRVDRIEVTQLIEGVELKRDGERWLAREITTPLKDEFLEKEDRTAEPKRWVRANRGRVNGALGSFGGLPEGVIVSSNEEKRRLYQVEMTGVRVKLFDKHGELIEDVIIGKNGPDLASSYVRRTDEDEVYLLKRTLTGVFTPFAHDWRERKLWILRPEDVVGVSVDSEKGSFAARKDKDGKWSDVSGRIAPDQKGMEKIEKTLLRLTAEGFSDDLKTEEGERLLTLVLEQSDGNELKLTIFKKDKDGRSLARLEGVHETYVLPEEFVGTIPTKLPAKKTD